MGHGVSSGILEIQGRTSATPGGGDSSDGFDDSESQLTLRTAGHSMRAAALRLRRIDRESRGLLSGTRRSTRSVPVLLQVSSVLLAALSVACTTSGSHDASRKELLQTLRQCLVQVSIHNGREGYQSPCAREDVSRLNGISRAELIEALGPPQFCTSATEGGFPEKDDCPADQNPQWSFYRLPQGIYAGGGPDLVCESDKRRRCVQVRWRSPK